MTEAKGKLKIAENDLDKVEENLESALKRAETAESNVDELQRLVCQ